MNATTIQQQQQNIVAGDWEQLAKVLTKRVLPDFRTEPGFKLGPLAGKL